MFIGITTRISRVKLKIVNIIFLKDSYELKRFDLGCAALEVCMIALEGDEMRSVRCKRISHANLSARANYVK